MIYILILLVSQFTTIDTTDENSVTDDGLPWIPNIICEGMLNYFAYSENSASLCSEQGRLVQIFSRNYTIWALKMIDSSSKGLSGVIYGSTYDFGHFDECVTTSAFNDSLRGKFMVVSLKLAASNHLTKHTTSFTPSDQYNILHGNHSYWNLLESMKWFPDKRIKERTRFNWALCVPDSCSNDDIRYSVNRTLTPQLARYGLAGNISILQQFTYSRCDKHWIPGAAIFGLITLILLLIVSIGTGQHYYKQIYSRKQVQEGGKLLCFSLYRNFSKLSGNEESISVISGLKVISLIIIIYGHRMFITMFSPIKNTYENEMVIGTLLNTYYLNGILIVDTFLVITGFLSFNKMLKIIDKFGQINFFRCILRRYFRFTPTYAFILGFTVWIYPYLEGGPLARGVIWDSKNCSRVWWTHLLYVNNYIHSEHQCIVPSWYLAADMQLYILCSMLAYVTGKSNKYVGLVLLIIITLLSIILPAIIVLLKGYKGFTLLYLSDFASYFKNKEFIETYLQTHFRASPYIIGMMAAWAYRQIESSKKSGFKMNHKKLLAALTLVNLAAMNVSILSAWWFYLPGQRHSSLEVMFYSILHRLGWALPLSWLIVLHSTHLFEPFQKILGFKGFGPLNQLSYSVFLLHTPLQLYLGGQHRDPVYYNWLTSWWMLAGDAIFSYGGALIIFLIVEAPFTNLFIF